MPFLSPCQKKKLFEEKEETNKKRMKKEWVKKREREEKQSVKERKFRYIKLFLFWKKSLVERNIWRMCVCEFLPPSL